MHPSLVTPHAFWGRICCQHNDGQMQEALHWDRGNIVISVVLFKLIKQCCVFKLSSA